MPITDDEILKLVQAVDSQFEEKPWIYLARLSAMYPRLILAIPPALLIYIGLQYSNIALDAAKASLLDLSIAVQALTVAILALIISFIPLIGSQESKRAEDIRLRGRVYNGMKSNGNPNPIILRVLLRMKMSLAKDISLEEARTPNPELFTEKELTKRLFDR